MEKILGRVSQAFTNPFIIAIMVVIVINLIIFFIIKPKIKKKRYFCAIFYMWLATTSIIYLHYNSLDRDFSERLGENMNLQLINRTNGAFEEIEPSRVGAYKMDMPKSNTITTSRPESISLYEDELI